MEPNYVCFPIIRACLFYIFTERNLLSQREAKVGVGQEETKPEALIKEKERKVEYYHHRDTKTNIRVSEEERHKLREADRR